MRMMTHILPVAPVVYRPVRKQEKSPKPKTADAARGVTGAQVGAVSRRADPPQGDDTRDDGTLDITV
jgi:hypothetical protein